jgi:copper chaperone for superoxide dismutase
MTIITSRTAPNKKIEFVTEFAVNRNSNSSSSFPTTDNTHETYKEDILHSLGPILNNCSAVDINSASNQVIVKGSIPPSKVEESLRNGGFRVIQRGHAALLGSNSNSALAKPSAVCAFDVKSEYAHASKQVQGVARLMFLEDDQTIVDLTVDNLTPDTNFSVSVNEFGDLSQGAESCGPALVKLIAQQDQPVNATRNYYWTTDSTGRLEAQGCFNKNLETIIGRSMCIQPVKFDQVGPRSQNESNLPSRPDNWHCGIIARSSGVFSNKKQICACSGRTLWEESSSWVDSGERTPLPTEH